MKKRIISMLICITMLGNTIGINANEQTTIGVNNDNKSDEVVQYDSNVLTNSRVVESVLEEYKYTARQGHGFAAENGNNFVDRLKGLDAEVVGNDNAPNGADRVIRNRDGSKTWIQDKYYKDVTQGINACFDEEGNFRYIDGEGNAMIIEVPSDQYEKAVELMRKKIEEGKIPNVTNPEEAENLVRKGALTWKQAENLSKAGTWESLSYDAANGVITASCAFGISVLLDYVICRTNGLSKEDSIDSATKVAIQTGAYAFFIHVITAQLGKTSAKEIFVPTAQALVDRFGTKFAENILKAAGKSVLEDASETAIRNEAVKILNGTLLTMAVTTVVLSSDDIYDILKGRISAEQFIKNLAETTIGVAGTTAGAYAGGAIAGIFTDGIGIYAGAGVGGFIGGSVSSFAGEKVMDLVIKDDADKMVEIVQKQFEKLANDYLISEEEANEIADAATKKLQGDTLKDMFESDNRDNGALFCP